VAERWAAVAEEWAAVVAAAAVVGDDSRAVRRRIRVVANANEPG
jgi:hypothetical protein